ncbi:zinc finger protein ubi-d4-like [Styela clava]|uniref:zinc finger protein ubi-d4-like n=1 Tax=Styela clava TaxID=7725 RepID=UPI001939C886|nr:zinc finger protein ubi-d4-like [Styela clava]
MKEMSNPPGISILFYKEAMEQCHSFNSRLMTERRVRLPYLDSQTGVAQNSCNLLFERWQRGPGLGPNQVYTYPSKRWKKKPRTMPILDPYSMATNSKSLTGQLIQGLEGHINENSNSSSGPALDFDAMSDIQDAGADEYGDDDDEDYDDDPRHRKRGRRPRGGGRGGGRTTRRTAMERDEEREKPHPCAYCGKRYKNKTGLNYHIQRYHQDEVDADEDYNPGNDNDIPSVVDQDSNPGVLSKSALPSSRSESMTGSNVGDDFEDEERLTRSKKKKQTVNSAYCDFCLGDADENKKTGESEELVSCSDCGRSGHPTCLQFTDIMTMNVKKYKWQCIECKSCHLCGTSDNDDQLLFCDDCDRGYHMYCLSPPMDEPPEGSWICDLCEADRKVREGCNTKKS